MKLSTIGTDRIAERTAKTTLDDLTVLYLQGKVGWGGVIEARTAYDTAVALVVQDMLDYDANPEAEV